VLGAIAQLGERIVRNDEVVGSIPTSSTISSPIYRAEAVKRLAIPGLNCYVLLRDSLRPDWTAQRLRHLRITTREPKTQPMIMSKVGAIGHPDRQFLKWMSRSIALKARVGTDRGQNALLRLSRATAVGPPEQLSGMVGLRDADQTYLSPLLLQVMERNTS
jgi:hypothetical protein